MDERDIAYNHTRAHGSIHNMDDEICIVCDKVARWYLCSPGGGHEGPFCEECSIDKVFEYSGWTRFIIDDLK